MSATQTAEAHTRLDMVVEARDVTRAFRRGTVLTQALRGVNIAVRPGEFVALRGRSGSGKTTLLNLLVGLDDPTSGQVTLLGADLAKLDEAARARLRRESVGIVFQNAHLFPSLTALENVETPLRLARVDPAKRQAAATRALERVGLGGRMRHRGLELSGGEQQRVSLARALAHSPRFIIADEPTGALDSLTGRDIIALFRAVAQESGIGLLVATHDPAAVNAADRIVRIEDGAIIEE